MMKTIIEISQELIDLENQLEELADNCEATEEAAERISQIIATFPDKLEVSNPLTFDISSIIICNGALPWILLPWIL